MGLGLDIDVSVLGKTVEKVREMGESEYKRMGWKKHRHSPEVLVLSDGTVLFPSRDIEGNGPGEFLPIGEATDIRDLEGETVSDCYEMTDEQMQWYNWGGRKRRRPTVIYFGGNRAIVASQDPEANEFGCLMGYDDECSDTEVFSFS